jgi:hypothetical protein
MANELADMIFVVQRDIKRAQAALDVAVGHLHEMQNLMPVPPQGLTKPRPEGFRAQKRPNRVPSPEITPQVQHKPHLSSDEHIQALAEFTARRNAHAAQATAMRTTAAASTTPMQGQMRQNPFTSFRSRQPQPEEIDTSSSSSDDEIPSESHFNNNY